MLRPWQFCLVLVVAGFAGCNAHPSSSPQPLPVSSAKNEAVAHLPQFSVTDFQGREISSADLRGKVLLVDFWATWCQPCRKEMPGYQKLADRYGRDGFAVVGFKLNIMKDTEDPAVFARRIGVHYPLAVATDELTQKFGGIEGLPTTMIFDRQGILRKKVIGFEYTDAMEAALKPLL
jgi:thiol-disulfide isomerase/thioredoxin